MESRFSSNLLNGGWTIVLLGFLFFSLYLVYVAVHDAYQQGPVWLFPVGLMLVSVLALGLVYGGYRVVTIGFTPSERWRVVIWVFAGLVAALALTFWPIFYQRIIGVAIEDPIFILLVSSGLGANAGVVAGISTLRSERQFNRVQEARDSLEFLNRLLRHNILNAVNIIRGNAELIVDHSSSEETSDRAATIREQSDQISDLIQNAKVLIQRIDNAASLEPIDLTRVVQQELKTIQKTYDDVAIDADVSQGVYVRADPLVSAVVENILTNAVVHNDQERPEIQVMLATTEKSAVLEITDNGPGLPDVSRETLVDPGPHGDHGLGLYLADTLVSQYGGELSFEEGTPQGTVVRIRLPVATPE